MTVVKVDDFTRGGGETSPYLISNHIAANGGSWVGTLKLSPSGYVQGDGGAVSTAMVSTPAPTSDYEIAFRWKYKSAVAGFERINGTMRNSSQSTTADGYYVGPMPAGGNVRLQIQDTVGLTAVAYTPAAGDLGSILTLDREYWVVCKASGATMSLAMLDTVTGQWLNTAGSAFNQGTRTEAVTYSSARTTGQYYGVQAYGAAGDTITAHIGNLYVGGINELTTDSPTPASGSFTATPSTIPDEDSAITIALAGTSTTWVAGGSEFSVSGLTGVSKVSENVTSTTAATLVVETVGGATGTLTITDQDGYTATVTSATATLAASPSSINPSTTTTVSLTGTNTLWTQETAAGLFTISGVAGCSISGTPSVGGNTSATISVVTGSTTGTLTITDTSNGSTTTVTVAAGPQTINVTNSAWYWSPGNWYSDGAGSMGANNVKASSTYARTWNVGAYFRFGFSGASAGNVVLNVDCSSLSAITSVNRPILMSSVDGAAPTETTLTSATTTVTLATTTASGTVKVWLKGIGTNSGGGDRWTTPTLAVKVTSLTIPAAASMVATTAKTRKMLVFGDSLAEGTATLSNTHDNTGQDGSQIWGALLADALDAEVAIVGCDTQGWSQSGIDNVPAFSSAWNLHTAGLSRLTSSLIDPQPDVIVINHGKNGTFTTGTVTSTLAAIRAAAPSAKIYVVVTFDQTNASSITGATMPDANCKVVNLGTVLGVSGSWWLTDGIHPSVRGHARLAAMLAKAIGSDLYATGGSAASFGTFGSGRL